MFNLFFLGKQTFAGGVEVQTVLKMALLLLVVLLTAGVSPNDAQQLPDIYKKGVELALNQINARHSIKHHFLFFKTIHQAEIQVTAFFSFRFSGKRWSEN